MLRRLVLAVLALSAMLAVFFVLEARALALTCPQIINGQVISPGDPKQNGRLNRGLPETTCALPTPAPPVINAGSVFTYDAHNFKNRTLGTCMTVTLQSNDDLSAAAYLGSFVPQNIQQNYLGDSGNRASAGNPKTFSFNVPSLSDFIVVVTEGVDGQGGNYQLSVNGCGEVLVTSITPNFGPTAGGTNVTIKGAGFLSVPGLPQVRFGGQAGSLATNVVVVDEFTITATTPPRAAGVVDVYIQNANGTNSALIQGFTYFDPVPSTVTLFSSKNPTVFGEAVTFNAHVDPNVPTPPTGAVIFRDNGVMIGTVNLDANGDAAFTTSGLAVGTHPIMAQYGGDPIHLTATSPIVNQVVNRADTTVTLISSSNPSVLGQSITFTATPVPVAPGAGLPSGNVIFREQGGPALATVALDANGQATFTTATLTVGTHLMIAEYGGDTNFNASTSTNLSQVVNVTGATVTIVSSQNPSSFSANVTFTATVASNGGGTPTGTVTFSDNGVALGAAVTIDAQGRAQFSTSALTVGTHPITAAYSGDGANAPANGSLSQVVDGAATTTTVTSSANPSTVGASVTFTATVTSAVAGTLTGNVTFRDGTTVLGTTALASGTAAFTTSTLTVGTHPITAVYAGTGSYKGSTSAQLDQVVTQPGAVDAGPIDSGKPDAAPPPDAAQPDATPPKQDAALPVDQTDIEGGGCDCRSATSSDAGALGGVATFAAVMVLLGGRRRRRER